MKIVIAGACDIGIYLATLLSHTHENITLIDDDVASIAQQRKNT